MRESAFNTEFQQDDLASKVVVGLERISEAFKVLLWNYAKENGLSPIQIQILIFTASHQRSLCNVSYLAKEFNVTKPTVSDAVRVLLKKELIQKIASSEDSRRYSIALSKTGKTIVDQTANFAVPITNQLNELAKAELRGLYGAIHQVIDGLHKTGVLQVQRNCFGCKFYELHQGAHYCHFLEKPLSSEELRIDCPEFEEKATGSRP